LVAADEFCPWLLHGVFKFKEATVLVIAGVVDTSATFFLIGLLLFFPGATGYTTPFFV
jgi:hypothetical protein